MTKKNPAEGNQGDAASAKLAPCLTVLVAGHENDRLPADEDARGRVFEQLDQVIGCLADLVREPDGFPPPFYDADAPGRMRILTGVCEGTDAAAGRIAKERQLPLHLLIPGQPPEDDATAYAERVVCLGGDGQEAGKRVARGLRDEIALGFADVLVAVWDGEAPRGLSGGTVRIILQAALTRKPVVWIDQEGHCHWLDIACLTGARLLGLSGYQVSPSYLAGCFRPVEGDRGVMADAIRPVLNPGTSGPRGRELAGFFEDRADWALLGHAAGGVHRLFDAVMGQPVRDLSKLRLFRKPGAYVGPVEPEAEHSEAHPVESPADLLERFRWSDLRANRAAGRHRDFTWLLYLFSAFAVFAAVAGAIRLWPGGHGPVWPVAELVVVLLIILAVWLSRVRQWHRRWISHRYLAEQLRYARMGYPLLVIPTPFTEPLWAAPDGQTKGGAPELRSAELWLLQRSLTTTGLPRAQGSAVYVAATPDHVRRLIDYVQSVVQDQLKYHEKNAKQMHTLHENLHRLALWLFVFVVASIIGHFIYHVDWWLIGTAFLPALAGAIHGVVTKREIARIASQSAQAAARLDDLNSALNELRSGVGEENSARDSDAEDAEATWRAWMRLRGLSLQAAAVMSDENNQWQRLIEQQEMEIPA